MLQSHRTLPVAQGQQKVVMIVMLRPKQFYRLCDQIAVKLNLCVSGGQLFRPVGNDIQAHAGG